ncbi:antibiotic biosynthesis monooxygenase [Streptomyces sp. MNU89]|uniref:antibiotic biosynthesis monooxygenase family protein n=1 Tax=Streptomyces sp. MNU89 TaxID=2560025 RepID=UPI001E328552|nr:antibiotic biosynthesis monooxygenase [Streptomyces sp. MNU89]MCC9738472.1 antibiotic biosynthesis monooxygenase [Streptomyces sp. MNU89]
MATEPFPDMARTGTAVIGTRYAGSPDRQRRTAGTEASELDRVPQPEGLTAVSWFLSTDGETVLTCAQWDSDAAHATYLHGSGPTPPLAGPPAYRLYRSLAEEHESRAPGCLITAAFDVDGPERQRTFTEAVVAAQPEGGGHPGAISAHFLHSTDGSRVLLYTEWTSIEAHRQAADAGQHDKGHEIFAGTPGVRLTHGGRWHLHRTVRSSTT